MCGIVYNLHMFKMVSLFTFTAVSRGNAYVHGIWGMLRCRQYNAEKGYTHTFEKTVENDVKLIKLSKGKEIYSFAE